jgi:hypothetical protein
VATCSSNCIRQKHYKRRHNGYVVDVEFVVTENGTEEFWAREAWELTPYSFLPTSFERNFILLLDCQRLDDVPLVDIDKEVVEYTLSTRCTKTEFPAKELRYPVSLDRKAATPGIVELVQRQNGLPTLHKQVDEKTSGRPTWLDWLPANLGEG